jgi:hypothetical protein
MFNTLVTWSKDDTRRTQVELDEMDQFVESLLQGVDPAEMSAYTTKEWSRDDDGNSVALRHWPTQEAADAWVSFILSKYPHAVISAVTN